ncbi:MAG: hypothetical protein KDD77_00270 [Caldilineaceae bacterium]|nr:hypothetical protein [Caldilineaceae bacterium]
MTPPAVDIAANGSARAVGPEYHYRPALLLALIPTLVVIVFAVPIYAHAFIGFRFVALNVLILVATCFSLFIALGAILNLVRHRAFDVNRALLLCVATFGNMALLIATAKIDNANLL